MPEQHSPRPAIFATPPSPGAAAAARASGAAASSGPGLVHSEQSERGPILSLENDGKRRIARCRRRAITHARLAAQAVEKGGFRGRWLMVTPTYREGVAWEPGHIRELLQRMRVWFRRQGQAMRYQWVMELTKRGRPHYHLLVWIPRHLMLPQADRRGWWTHGMTRTEVARNAVGYLAKYASKGSGLCDDQGREFRYPKGARICGGGGLEVAARTELRWWMTPRWFRDQVGEVVDVRRVPGGYVRTDTGEVYASPWVFVGCSPGWKALLFRRKESTPCQTPTAYAPHAH